MCVPKSNRCLGLLQGNWWPFKGHQCQTTSDQADLHFQFLKRCGTQKSNSRIRSYGSRKFVVRQSVHHLGFCDISAILTPILTYEQLLEREFDDFRNGIGFNPFWQLDQNQGFQVHLGSTSGQTWSNLLKISKKLGLV